MKQCFFIVFLIGFIPTQGQCRELEPYVFGSVDQKNHTNFMKQLSPDQVKVLSATYPDFRIVKLCSGRFSGSNRDEVVLGVWKPVASKDWWKRDIHRVGLIWNGSGWEAHLIDDELDKDLDKSHLFPMRWEYKGGEAGFAGEVKCGVETEFGKDSDLTYLLGDKPFFDLKKTGLQKNKVICFATDDDYNNWDCVVYSPKDGRFKLWFQQAHAD